MINIDSDSSRHTAVSRMTESDKLKAYPYSRLLVEWSKVCDALCSTVIEYSDSGEGNVLALYPLEKLKTIVIPEWVRILIKLLLKTGLQQQTRQLTFSVEGRRLQTIVVGLQETSTTRIAAVFCFQQLPLRWQQNATAAFAEITGYLQEKRLFEEEQGILHELELAVLVSSEVNKGKKFREAVSNLVNEVAAQWNCSRVSLGITRSWGIKIAAISRVGSFESRIKLVRDIQEAMLECSNQDLEVLFPGIETSPVMTSAAAELAAGHGTTNTLALPVRYDGKIAGVLLLERSSNVGFALGDCQALRIMLELTTSRLVELEHASRWLGVRIARTCRHYLRYFLGPEHIGVKFVALLLLGCILFLIFSRGEYRIDASFVLEPQEKVVVAAPFDSFLKAVEVEPAEVVSGGRTVLGELDTSELVLQRVRVFAEQVKNAKEAALARSEHKTVEAQIAEAKASEAAARLALINLHLKQAKLVAPVSGYIASKEIDLKLGSPLQQGTVLFEILPNDNLRVEMFIAEDDIADVAIGQEGEIAVMGYPDRKIPIRVVQIFPVAQLEDEKNSFKVEADMATRPDWLKPGMEGVAKISAGERNRAWICTHAVINWLRLKLWI